MATNEVSKPPIRDFGRDKMREDGDSLAAEALWRFLGDREATLDRLPVGLSGGRVYRCRTAAGGFALKQWPTNTPAARIDEVHAVQKHAHRFLAVVPQLLLCSDGMPRLSLGGSLHFELATWMPGAPFIDPLSLPESSSASDSDVTRRVVEAVRAGAAVVARFHRATQSLGVSEAIAPAVGQRLNRLSELPRELSAAIPVAQGHGGLVNAAARYLERHGRRLIEESRVILRDWAVRPVAVQWVLRDVHREHMLFERGRVSGIVDFDAIRRDTKATDLARWVGSFAELGIDVDALWNAAISGYGSELAISPCEQSLAGAIERASWCIHLANWVIWSGTDSQEIPGGIATANRRIAWLLRRSGVRVED